MTDRLDPLSAEWRRIDSTSQSGHAAQVDFDAVPMGRPGDPLPTRRRGDTVALRSIRDFPGHGVAVGFAVAAIVIAEDVDLVVVCTTSGSSKRTRAGRGSGPNRRTVLPADWDGSYDEEPWNGDTVVRVHRFGDRFSVWRWHDGTAWTDRWYGNLESPWQRSSIGYDTEDWTLDVIANGAPRSPSWTVRFKDEDELAWKVRRGHISLAAAEHVRTAGEELIALATRATWPFDADWDSWVPDPDWGPTALPAAWRTI